MGLVTGHVLHDRYRIVNLLAQGTYSAVYRAWDLTRRSHCAVKVNFVAGRAARPDFLRAAQAFSQLNHPHLPPLIDYFFVPDQGQYLVMDYIEGVDLDEMMRTEGENLPQAQVVEWFYQVCTAVQTMHAHAPTIVHGDIHPANIRITPQGQAVLLGYGIDRVFDQNSHSMVRSRAATPGYSPPEQYHNGPVDNRADVYSLGATLYTLLSGERPPSSTEMISGLAAPNPAIAPDIHAAISKAMQMEKRSRFASVTQFVHSLTEAQIAGGVEWPEKLEQNKLAVQPAKAPLRRAAFRQKKNLVLGSILLVAVLMVGMLIGWGGVGRYGGENLKVVRDNLTQTSKWLALGFTQTVQVHEEILHATETVLQVATPLPTMESATPSPLPTQPVPLLIADLNLELDNFEESDSVCFESAEICLLGVNGDKAIRILDLYVSPSWLRPYLIFSQQYNFPQSITGNIHINDDLIATFEGGPRGWHEAIFSLADYRGETISIKISVPWGISYIDNSTWWGKTVNINTEWTLQELRVEPNYKP